jgi:hypothetical protein
LQEAIRKDPDHLGKIKRAEDDVQTFAIVASKFKKLYIEKNALRTGKVMWQQIEKHLMPTFREVEFATIKRRSLMECLDKIEAANGAAMVNVHVVRIAGRGLPVSDRKRDEAIEGKPPQACTRD